SNLLSDNLHLILSGGDGRSPSRHKCLWRYASVIKAVFLRNNRPPTPNRHEMTPISVHRSPPDVPVTAGPPLNHAAVAGGVRSKHGESRCHRSVAGSEPERGRLDPVAAERERPAVGRRARQGPVGEERGAEEAAGEHGGGVPEEVGGSVLRSNYKSKLTLSDSRKGFIIIKEQWPVDRSLRN
ncbi:hypothetical protein NQ317_002144, partial [Molorchus minor]